jgi:hypothetical protein
MDHKERMRAQLAREGYNFNDPAVCVAFERTHSTVGRKIVEYGDPGPDAATPYGARGAREHYPGTTFTNTNAEHHAYKMDMQRQLHWDEEQDRSRDDVDQRLAIYRQVGIKQGLGKQTGVHDTKRFSYIENHQPQYMEHFTEDGQQVLTPVVGGGQATNIGGSKYSHLPDAPTDPDAPINYGQGTEEQSKFFNVSEPPRLPNGDIDYETMNRMHGHEPARGRRNIMMRKG